jgi:hypothetical protein
MDSLTNTKRMLQKYKLSTAVLTIIAGLSCFGSASITPIAVAQTKTCTELLGQTDAVTFKDSQCTEVKLTKATTFYRYHDNDGNKYGRFITTSKYTNNVDVIKNLALSQSWANPNKATKIITVTIPAGNYVYQGIVAEQPPKTCYPGGGQQTFIRDTRDATITWSTSQDITVKTFTCP